MISSNSLITHIITLSSLISVSNINPSPKKCVWTIIICTEIGLNNDPSSFWKFIHNLSPGSSIIPIIPNR